MKRHFLFILTYLLCAIPLLAQNTLQVQLNDLLNDSSLSTSEVGITVFDLTTGQPLFNYQDKKLYRPASIQKLITGITGLSNLGTNYTLDTSIYYSGVITNNELNGDLYIIGGFDPEFGEQGMDFLLNKIDSIGIKRINGNLFGDISMTDSLYWGPGWCWDDTPFSFQPYLSALMYCRGYVEVTARPTQKGSIAHLSVYPPSTYYTISNQTKSHTPSAGKFTVTRNWLSNENHIIVSGNVNGICKDEVNIYTSKDFFMHTFMERLRAKGIYANKYSWKKCPNEAVHSIGKYSHSMPEVLNRAMKKSDNLSAEAIFYHLAAQKTDKKTVGSKDGADAILCFINKLGLSATHYKIVDGSGVSVYNYVSPELVLAYLKYAYINQDIYKQIYETLPIAGVDGTLSGRMKQGKAFRNVRAKTGTITGVSSLAGYTKAKNNHLLAFVVINQNILDQKKARAFQDNFCEILSNTN